MKIGVEVELYGGDYNYLEILSRSELDLFDFREREALGDIGVKLSEEYYSNTIEYNFTPFDSSGDGLKKVNNYLGDEITKYGFSLSSSAPQFIGTHIHFFDNRFSSFSNKKKEDLLRGILYFISNNLDGLDNNSLLRLFTGHQLWGNWSYKNQHIWYDFMNSYNYKTYYYSSAEYKTKYKPVITSPETDLGKPKSLEIRLIPNEYLFNGKLQELLELIDNGKIFENQLEPLDFFIKLDAIIKPRTSLSDLYIDSFQEILDRTITNRDNRTDYSNPFRIGYDANSLDSGRTVAHQGNIYYIYSEKDGNYNNAIKAFYIEGKGKIFIDFYIIMKTGRLDFLTLFSKGQALRLREALLFSIWNDIDKEAAQLLISEIERLYS